MTSKFQAHTTHWLWVSWVLTSAPMLLELEGGHSWKGRGLWEVSHQWLSAFIHRWHTSLLFLPLSTQWHKLVTRAPTIKEVPFWNWKEIEVTQSCPTLCNLMDCSLPGSSVHGIFQARILEWVATSFSRGSSQPRARTRVSETAGSLFTIWPTKCFPFLCLKGGNLKIFGEQP